MRRLAVDRLTLALLLLVVVGPLLLPVLPRLRDARIGIPHFDAHGTAWFYDHARRVLLEGASPLHTDRFYFPWGKDIYGDTGANLLDAFLALPFLALLGPVAGYNLFVLLGLVGAGVALAWAARGAGVEPRSAVVAGVLAAAGPYVLVELIEGRPTQAILALPALFLGLLVRLGPGSPWGRSLGAGLVLALVGLQYWYYGLFFGLAGLCWGGVELARAGPGRRALLGRLVVVFGTALLLVAPLALPMLWRADMGEVRGLLHPESLEPPALAILTREGETIALYLWQPLAGEAGFLKADAPGGATWFPMVDPGAPGLGLLALPGLLALRWRGLGLLLGLLLAGGIAVGPVLLVGERLLANRPYLLLVEHIALLQRLWWPGRAWAVVALLLPLLAGFGLQLLGTRWPRAWPPLVLLAGLSLALHLRAERLAPLPVWASTPPRGLSCLARAGEGAVIALPEAATQAALLQQIEHGRPMLGGMNPILAPADSQRFQEGNGLLRAMRAVTERDPRRVRPGPRGVVAASDATARAALVEKGFRFVLLDLETYDLPWVVGGEGRSDEVRASVLRGMEALLGAPFWLDERLGIWDLTGPAPECADLPGEARRAPDLRLARSPREGRVPKRLRSAR